MPTKATARAPKKGTAHPKRPQPPDDGTAFLPDPREGAPMKTSDDLAEELAEDYVQSATSAEEQGEDIRDAFAMEELGGPFLEVGPDEEFATGPDASNPPDAEREPFPTAVRVSRNGNNP